MSTELNKRDLQLKRRRITAPRNREEAARMISQLSAQFDILDIEEQLMNTINMMQEKFDEKLHAVMRAAYTNAMLATGTMELKVKPDEMVTPVAGYQLSFTEKPDEGCVLFTLTAPMDDGGTPK